MLLLRLPVRTLERLQGAGETRVDDIASSVRGVTAVTKKAPCSGERDFWPPLAYPSRSPGAVDPAERLIRATRALDARLRHRPSHPLSTALRAQPLARDANDDGPSAGSRV
jgi:hypothetical protein